MRAVVVILGLAVAFSDALTTTDSSQNETDGISDTTGTGNTYLYNEEFFTVPVS
jgi:hypothetical protein